jgi:hypothetical protein
MITMNQQELMQHINEIEDMAARLIEDMTS